MASSSLRGASAPGSSTAGVERARATAPFRSYGRNPWRAAVVVVACAASACGPRALPPLTPPPVLDAADRRVREWQREVAALLDAPALHHGVVAVTVRSLTRGDTLFRWHGDTLVMPASNMKIVTLATAAERLGWDYAFATRIGTTGAMSPDGVLSGDLVIRGSGDPTLGTTGPPAEQVLDGWAAQLWDKGLRRIEGRVVGDDRAIPGPGLGAGWSWDYLGAGYAAPIGALQVNGSAATITITGGPFAGSPAVVALAPAESGLLLQQSVTTSAADTTASLEVDREPATDIVRVSGSVPATRTVLRTAAVRRPVLYTLRMVRSALERRGIAVRDGVWAIDDLPPSLQPADGDVREWLVHRSPPLRELAVTMMKRSSNQYAETLLATLGGSAGTSATAEHGRQVVLDQLTAWGLPTNALVLADGSGLTRYDFVTTDLLVSVLERMYRDPRHREAWLATLPVAGVDGTLAERFKGSAASGAVRAKTGSISNVRALSGYVPPVGGEWLVFAIVVNNVTAPGPEVTAPVDAVVNRMIAFRR